MLFGKLHSVVKTALIWGCVGFGVAVLFFILSLFTDVLAYVEFIFWPSSFTFMALDNSTATRLDWVEGTTFLIFSNFVLYFVVGFVVTLVWRALKRWLQQ